MNDRIAFYKDFYTRDLSRRTELDNAVNMPVLTITSIVSLNTYFIKESLNPYGVVSVVLNILIFLSITISLYFICKSFFNLGKTNKYLELNSMNEYHAFDKKMQTENTPDHYVIYLENELAKCSTHNFQLNVKRTKALAFGKQALFISVVVTFFLTLNFLITITNKNQTNMAKKTETPSTNTSTKPVSAEMINGPISMYIQNSQDGRTVIIKGNIKKVK